MFSTNQGQNQLYYFEFTQSKMYAGVNQFCIFDIGYLLTNVVISIVCCFLSLTRILPLLSVICQCVTIVELKIHIVNLQKLLSEVIRIKELGGQIFEAQITIAFSKSHTLKLAPSIVICNGAQVIYYLYRCHLGTQEYVGHALCSTYCLLPKTFQNIPVALGMFQNISKLSAPLQNFCKYWGFPQ
eukprot:TRINITY_DN158_c1_g1_i10.p4 TRINITY_DN158_c1_g1~~TRINITY_DN158_c1_g1_i10.p4  ORF type:complete len:185 (-),score=-3.60 TRINITY_DN158_c1_g1_i10:325-879(-)